MSWFSDCYRVLRWLGLVGVLTFPLLAQATVYCADSTESMRQAIAAAKASAGADEIRMKSG